MIDILCHRRTALKCKGTSKIIGCPVKLNKFIDLYFAKLLLSINWVFSPGPNCDFKIFWQNMLKMYDHDELILLLFVFRIEKEEKMISIID